MDMEAADTHILAFMMRKGSLTGEDRWMTLACTVQTVVGFVIAVVVCADAVTGDAAVLASHCCGVTPAGGFRVAAGGVSDDDPTAGAGGGVDVSVGA